MTQAFDNAALIRIANALERLSPPPAPPADLTAHAAYRWDGGALAPVPGFRPLDYAELPGNSGYVARFVRAPQRPAPGSIRVCEDRSGT